MGAEQRKIIVSKNLFLKRPKQPLFLCVNQCKFQFMLTILSPAKRLKETNAVIATGNQTPLFFEDAVKINKALKRYGPKKLMQLQHISKDLAELNWQRNQDWNTAADRSYYEAVHLFNGDAYVGLDAASLNEDTLDYAQHHLRILSGLYGMLKPLDVIEPYRLEMGTDLKVGRRNNLYAFWADKLAPQLKKEFGDTPVVNLASMEYSKAIDRTKLKNPFIDVVFKDRNRGGAYRVMSFYAKKARGMMTRFILENNIEDPKELVHFDVEGYMFSANDSGPRKLVFLRDH
jgi:cytoplasmic iron level regulating protein YaaA (DUF328/UPF0246 family)